MSKELGTKRTVLLTIHSSFGIAMGNVLQAGHWFCFTGLILGLFLIFVLGALLLIFILVLFVSGNVIFNGYFHIASR
jgi:hypothetical protein